jgi:hypothetical protein
MASDMRDTASSASAGSLDARRNSPGARIVWIESARGLGILLVVVGHVLHGLTAHGLMAAGPLHRVWDSEYYNARMPLFFVLSGLFAERWAARDGGAFLLDKAATLVYPYFLWSTLQGVVRIAMATAVKGESPFEYLIWMPVYPVMQFWFIYVLFFISLWHFAMRKSGLGAVGCVVVAMLLYGVRPWGGENMQSSPMPLLRILYYAPFYAVGALAGLHLDRLRVEGALRQGAVAIGGLAVVVAGPRRPAARRADARDALRGRRPDRALGAAEPDAGHGLLPRPGPSVAGDLRGPHVHGRERPPGAGEPPARPRPGDPHRRRRRDEPRRALGPGLALRSVRFQVRLPPAQAERVRPEARRPPGARRGDGVNRPRRPGRPGRRLSSGFARSYRGCPLAG